MKKLLSIVVLFAVMVTGAMATGTRTIPVATDSDIIPGVVSMEYTDSLNVEYCIVYVDEVGATTPAPGLDVKVNTVCKDENSIPGCQMADSADPAEFGVNVIDSVTDETGCATLELWTEDAFGGSFYYEVNGAHEGEVLTRETGAAYVPEFTAIGAGLALIGAGFIAAKKRKE